MISADTTVVISVVFYSVYRTVVDTNQNASWILVFSSFDCVTTVTLHLNALFRSVYLQ